MKCEMCDLNFGNPAPARSLEEYDSIPWNSLLVKFLAKEYEQIKLC